MSERIDGPADLPEVEEITTLAQLDEASAALTKAANRLYRQQIRFEGYIDANGEFVQGVGSRYRTEIEEEKIRIYDAAIDAETRPPAEDIRAAKAEKRVREKHPGLYRDWIVASTEITALRQWISGMKAAVNARQSVLKGERD